MNKRKQTTNRQRKLQKPWTAQEDRLLVRFVAEQDAVWDSQSPNYKHRDIRNNCWAVIAYNTNHTVSDTKIHWNTLRSRYNVERKKVLESIERQDKLPYKSTFALYKSLQFLSKFECKSTTPTTSVIKTESLDVSSSQPTTDNSMITQTESYDEPEYLCSPPTSPCTSSSMNYTETGYTDNFIQASKRKQKQSLDPQPNSQRTALMEEITCFLRSHREVPKEVKWKRAFGDLIYHELNRYDELDAQNLKKQLIMVFLNFKPGENHQNVFVESSEKNFKQDS